MRTTTSQIDRIRKMSAAAGANKAHCHPRRPAVFSIKFHNEPLRDLCSLECLVAEYERRGRVIGGDRGA